MIVAFGATSDREHGTLRIYSIHTHAHAIISRHFRHHLEPLPFWFKRFCASWDFVHQAIVSSMGPKCDAVDTKDMGARLARLWKSRSWLTALEPGAKPSVRFMVSRRGLLVELQTFSAKWNIKKSDIDKALAVVLQDARPSWDPALDEGSVDEWKGAMIKTIVAMCRKVAKAARADPPPKWVGQLTEGDGLLDTGSDEDDETEAEEVEEAKEEEVTDAKSQKEAAAMDKGGTAGPPSKPSIFGWDPVLRLAWRSEVRPNCINVKKDYCKSLKPGPNDFIVAKWADGYEKEIYDVTNEEYETFAACENKKKTGSLFTYICKGKPHRTEIQVFKKDDKLQGYLFLAHEAVWVDGRRSSKQVCQHIIGKDTTEEVRQFHLKEISKLVEKFGDGKITQEEFKQQKVKIGGGGSKRSLEGARMSKPLCSKKPKAAEGPPEPTTPPTVPNADLDRHSGAKTAAVADKPQSVVPSDIFHFDDILIE